MRKKKSQNSSLKTWRGTNNQNMKKQFQKRKQCLSLEKTSKGDFVQNLSFFFSHLPWLEFVKFCFKRQVFLCFCWTSTIWINLNCDSWNFGEFWFQFDFLEKTRKNWISLLEPYFQRLKYHRIFVEYEEKVKALKEE